MIAYTVLMWAIAVLFLLLGTMIYRGKIELIHEYHRTNVKEKDRMAYGRAFAKGIFALAFTLILSGAAALLGRPSADVAAALGILFIGLVAALFGLWRVQRRYNGGVF